MFIAAIFVIARNCKQYIFFNQRVIRKLQYIYTMDYYIAIKNNDIIKVVGKWIELEKIILSEVTQIQDKHGIYSLISGYWP